jgi:ribosome-associated toxin RatA of RatAB toxin-antitoxin module
MITVNASREMSAPVDRIWNIVADVDNEPKYWRGTKTVKNISKAENKIEREVIIAFKDSKCRQTVLLTPKKSVEIMITQGPIRGHQDSPARPFRQSQDKDRCSMERQIDRISRSVHRRGEKTHCGRN